MGYLADTSTCFNHSLLHPQLVLPVMALAWRCHPVISAQALLERVLAWRDIFSYLVWHFRCSYKLVHTNIWFTIQSWPLSYTGNGWQKVILQRVMISSLTSTGEPPRTCLRLPTPKLRHCAIVGLGSWPHNPQAPFQIMFSENMVSHDCNPQMWPTKNGIAHPFGNYIIEGDHWNRLSWRKIAQP